MNALSDLEERGHEQPIVGTEQWRNGEVRRYLASGDYDSSFAGWPGDNFVDVARKASHRLRVALVDETLRRASGFGSQILVPGDLHAWSLRKLSPMVWGLFPS